jgi:Peptidase family M48
VKHPLQPSSPARPVLRSLACLALVWALSQHGSAQPTPRSQEVVEARLRDYDERVLKAYQSTFARDHRYEPVLARVASRLNPHLPEVFGPQAKTDAVTYHVFLGRLGFNARTWHRIIIVDSLLLDALQRLAEGLAVDPSFESPYVKRLAFAVASVHAARTRGALRPDLSNRGNPYNLPRYYGLEPAQRDRAQAQLEAFIAGWLAHEAAHAYLGHTRKRYEEWLASTALGTGGSSQGDDLVVAESERDSFHTSSQAVERQADQAAVCLLIRAGYEVGPMLDTLVFSDLLERWLGSAEGAPRTHPALTERVEAIEAAAQVERARVRAESPKPAP